MGAARPRRAASARRRRRALGPVDVEPALLRRAAAGDGLLPLGLEHDTRHARVARVSARAGAGARALHAAAEIAPRRRPARRLLRRGRRRRHLRVAASARTARRRCGSREASARSAAASSASTAASSSCRPACGLQPWPTSPLLGATTKTLRTWAVVGAANPSRVPAAGRLGAHRRQAVPRRARCSPTATAAPSRRGMRGDARPPRAARQTTILRRGSSACRAAPIADYWRRVCGRKDGTARCSRRCGALAGYEEMLVGSGRTRPSPMAEWIIDDGGKPLLRVDTAGALPPTSRALEGVRHRRSGSSASAAAALREMASLRRLDAFCAAHAWRGARPTRCRTSSTTARPRRVARAALLNLRDHWRGSGEQQPLCGDAPPTTADAAAARRRRARGRARRGFGRRPPTARRAWRAFRPTARRTRR